MKSKMKKETLETSFRKVIKEIMLRTIIMFLCILGMFYLINLTLYSINPQNDEFYKKGFQDGKIECQKTVLSYLDNVKDCEYLLSDNSYSELNRTKYFQECLKK